ncbi:MAG: 3'-5' exonuclease [Acidobacteria bacterium]|nr:3'-5' exonuclease [Acidobacteriota bacterium]
MRPASLLNDIGVLDDILALLEANGRVVSFESIGREVFRLRNPHHGQFRQVVQRLVRDDPRFRLTPNDHLELLPDPAEQVRLGETDFVVLDVETTGINPRLDRITEIAAFSISKRHSAGVTSRVAGPASARGVSRLGDGHTDARGRSLDSEFVTLINPEREIPAAITRLTGITDEMVASAPLFSDVAEEFLTFLGDAVVVGHNAHFDINLINQEIRRIYGKRLGNPRLCTLQLCRRLFPDLPNYRLHTIAREMGVDHHARHRAWGDALATAMIFLRVLEVLEERGAETVLDARRLHLARRPAPPPS